MSITLVGREAFVQGVTDTPLPEGWNVALELAAQSSIHEGIMLIFVGSIVFLLVCGIR